MSSRKPLSVAVHRALYSVAICSTAASAPGLAQEQGPPDALEEITVTGSRIATDPNLVISSPVTQLTAEEFNYRGITRVEDLINDLPQITPELTANESNGATGTATLDLRGLGSDRTLVLVNGHRMGFGDPFVLAPDVNQIPGALVERVELLTGGASSTYGSDAVSGVVNFIMKDDFEGFQLDYQYSAYQHSNDNPIVEQALQDSGFELAPSSVGSEGGTSNITLTVGTNTEDGRGNVTAYLGYRDIEAITQDAYMFSACALDSDGANVCGGSATSAEGLFTDFGAAGPLIGLDPDTDAILEGPYFLLTPEGDQFVSGVPLYNYGPLNHFQRPDERYSAGAFAHYDINDNMTGYAEVMFMDDRSLAQIAPSGAFFVTSTIQCQDPDTGAPHPLLSDQQFAAICENDRVVDVPDNPATTADEAALSAGLQSCTNGTLESCPLYIGRRNVEGGNRVSDLRHTSYRFLGGLRGEIGDNWSWDASANFARMIYSNTYENDFSIRRLQRALDVVDGDGDPNTFDPVCRSATNGVDPGCVPYNVFEEGGVTQDALSYLIQPLFAKGELDLDQFVAFVSGDLTDSGFVTPWASDGVEMVFGAEYREETFDYNPDQNFQSGDGAGQGGPTSAVAGGQDVSELFTEFRIPIAQDMPFAQALSLDLRYRYSDYSTGVDADTYNIGGSWVPVEGVKFRGGFSRAVRAPNIRELFAPQSLGLWGGTDPCAGPDPVLSQEECVRTGLSAGQYGAVPANPAGQYNAIFGGNPDLGPESSDSITAGVVLTGLMDGLTLSVDYWSIEIEDAISTVDPELIINRCGVTGDPLLCGLIQRGSNGNLWLGQNAVVSTQVNIGSFDVAGVDVVGNYVIDTTDFGSFDLNLRGTWLSKFDEEPIPGADTIECAGFWGSSCGRPRPEWKHTFTTVWQSPWDTWSFIGGWRYVGEVEMFDNPDGYTATAQHYFDLTANYTADWFGGEETVINAGVTNLADNDPPVSGLFGTVGTYGNGNTIPSTWDALGRYWFVGLTQRF